MAARSMPGGDLNNTSSRIMPMTSGEPSMKTSSAPSALGHDHVVHIHVGRKLPAIGDEIVDHTRLIEHGQPVSLQSGLELIRGHELVPLMGAARQPAQHVFGADDG